MNPTITLEDCKQILSNLHNDENTNPKSFNLEVASSDHDGFFGDSHFLDITYQINGEEKERSFFVKIFPKNEDNAEMAKNLLAYEKEVFFYKTLVPRLQKIAKIETNFVPRCYFLKEEKIIVLENLLEQNYRNIVHFPLEEIRSGLKSIAELHAGSILLEEIDEIFSLEKEFPEVFEERFFDVHNPKSFVYNHFVEGLKCLEKLVEFIPQIKNVACEFVEQLKNIDFQKVFDENLGSRKVCCHGDLWRRNLLFQKKTTQCKLIDFQMLRYFYPAFDILSYIYFNLSPKLFKIHREELLEYYYKCVDDTLSSRDIQIEKILPYEEFMKTIDHFEVLAIFQAAVGHTLDIENQEIVGDMFFGDRLRYCLLEFGQNQKYREALTNDIICLVEHVLKISVDI